ncbi:MAG: alpha/beta hydrolase [Alistipes sp.]|nr:alpha/beta hydrolase [Alistipes sp.]
MLNYKIYRCREESPWIVMIHGAGGSIEVWHRQINDFVKHFNLLLVDLAGHGDSSNRTDIFDFDSVAEQVIEVVDYNNISTAHFMGLSLGSIIVRVIADRHSSRVSSMLLAGAVTQLCWESRALLRWAGWINHILPYRMMKWLIAKILIPNSRYRNSMSMFLKSAKRLSFENFLKWLNICGFINKRVGRLFNEKLSIPTLYLMGEDDYFFLPHAHQAMLSGGKMAQLAVLPRAGHVCNIDNKRDFNRLAIEFIQHIGSSLNRL